MQVQMKLHHCEFEKKKNSKLSLTVHTSLVNSSDKPQDSFRYISILFLQLTKVQKYQNKNFLVGYILYFEK